MSPNEYRILDIRMPPDPSRTVEVSTAEEFLLFRVVFLVVGMVMMATAHTLSESVVFYYGGAMTIGIILVILMILFQGMRLLPTGRKGSLAIFMYSSAVGVTAFLLSYLSGFLRSILVEIEISEDMHYPVAGGNNLNDASPNNHFSDASHELTTEEYQTIISRMQVMSLQLKNNVELFKFYTLLEIQMYRCWRRLCILVYILCGIIKFLIMLKNCIASC